MLEIVKYGEDEFNFPALIVLGCFDGLHLGHAELLKKAKLQAKINGLDLGVMMFVGGKGGRQLYSFEERVKFLEPYNVKFVLAIDYNDDFKKTTAAQFLKCIENKINVKAYMSGKDFRFGAGAKGKSATLKKYAEDEENGVWYMPVKDVLYDGEKISSSLIKEKLSAGDVLTANLLLGKNFSVTGTVTYGADRGASLGFPTMNIKYPEDKAEVKQGVYVVKCRVGEGEYSGIANYGARPTFDEQEPVLEVYLKDFEGSVYGEQITVEFVDFIREIIKFGTSEELIAQLKKDLKVLYGDTAEPVEEIEAAEPVEIIEETETVEPVEVVEETETVEPVEVVEETETDEPVEIIEETETEEPVEVVEQAEAVEPVEVVEETEMDEPVEVVDETETEEPVEVIEETETDEPVEDFEKIEAEELVEAVDDTETEEPVEAVEETEADEPIEVIEETETDEPVELVEETEAAELVEVVEETEADEPVESVEETEIEEPVEVIEENETEEPVEVVEDTEIEEPVEVVEETEADEPVEVIEETETEEPVEVIEETETEELVEIEEPVEIIEETEIEEPVEESEATFVEISEDTEYDGGEQTESCSDENIDGVDDD